ncbi:MAG: hypothetical protein ABEI86_08990, partial [Halobacteriaceae archaeon]
MVVTQEVVADNYEEYIGRLLDGLIPDRPPKKNEVTYTEIDKIDEKGIGYSVMGDEDICLGPVAAKPGDIVKIEGTTDTTAKILTADYRGENYELRFNILSERYANIPVSEGEEFTSPITEVKDGTPVSYVKDIPINFPNSDAAIGQKIDGRIAGFSEDQVIGEILQKYDEVVRVENAGHWARIHWLSQQGFGDEPMTNFATEFLGVQKSSLPDKEDLIRDALIAETIRLALQDKAGKGPEYGYARA